MVQMAADVFVRSSIGADDLGVTLPAVSPQAAVVRLPQRDLSAQIEAIGERLSALEAAQGNPELWLLNAAGEPGNATLNKRPMLAAGAAAPRNVFTVPAGGTTAAITLSSELVPFQVVQVVGFVARQFVTKNVAGIVDNDEVFVEDLQVPGAGVLFSHSGPIAATEYDTPLDRLVPLRNKPTLNQIEQATVSMFAVGTATDIVRGSAALVCRVLADTRLGHRHNKSMP